MVKITRITIETESVQIGYRHGTATAWCPACCATVDTITLKGNSPGEEIAPARLRSRLATGKLHCRSPEGGLLQICLKSLLRCLKSEDASGEPNPKRNPTQKGEGQ